ncbi:MAG TPA: hypothetical protein VF461_17765 [Gemmatimonadaceae bacterium]
MSEAATPDRFTESIQQAFDSCWPPAAQSFRSASFDFGSEEEERLEADLRLAARADFILPFAAAGLIDERARVGRLPAPADIRREVREAGLADRYMSAGCRIAQNGEVDPSLGEELAREWSTWLSFCIRAHSPELRRTLPFLFEARDAIMRLPSAPKLTIERLGPDGERLISLVPRRAEDPEEAARVDSLLDQCEVVAAHADAFRTLGPLFPRLIATVSNDQPRQSSDHESAFPFVVELWPFSMDSFLAVAQICDTIQRLAKGLSVGEEDQDRETRADSYVR